jgi:hypothetical protein
MCSLTMNDKPRRYSYSTLLMKPAKMKIVRFIDTNDSRLGVATSKQLYIDALFSMEAFLP